jgi:hypothetical protein
MSTDETSTHRTADAPWRPGDDVMKHPDVRQAAARFRVVLDHRDGVETPQWILDLADVESDPFTMRMLMKRRRPGILGLVDRLRGLPARPY